MSDPGFLRRVAAAGALLVVGAVCSCQGGSPDPESTGGNASGGDTGASGGPAGGSGPSGGYSAGGGASGGTPSTGGAASGGAPSTGGAGLGGAPEGADWTTTEERVGFSCGNSICHGGTEELCLAKDADRLGGNGSSCLPGTNLYQTLLGTRVSRCGDRLLVDPGKPEESAIVLLMTRQCDGFVMPADCPSEDQGYPTCWPEYAVLELSTWIARGASLE